MRPQHSARMRSQGRTRPARAQRRPCPRRCVFRAVVFAYSEVGYQCLQTLLEAAVDVPLVLTHEDSPTERQWFRSVARLAAERGIESAAPADPATPEWVGRIASLAPEFLFSF